MFFRNIDHRMNYLISPQLQRAYLIACWEGDACTLQALMDHHGSKLSLTQGLELALFGRRTQCVRLLLDEHFNAGKYVSDAVIVRCYEYCIAMNVEEHIAQLEARIHLRLCL